MFMGHSEELVGQFSSADNSSSLTKPVHNIEIGTNCLPGLRASDASAGQAITLTIIM